MHTDEKIYEGKAKVLYPTDDPQVFQVHFKDDATAFNAQKRGAIAGKGRINCTISAHLFQMLAKAGIANHFLSQPAPDQMLVRAVQIIPVEVVVRNIAAGSLCQQTGLPLGTPLKKPLVEFYYKNDDLGDPLLTRERLLLLELATAAEIEQLEALARQINEHLICFFSTMWYYFGGFQTRIWPRSKSAYSPCRRDQPRYLPPLEPVRNGSRTAGHG